ncbi:hypothetical protein JMN32_16800 [Fulvivirga sp. 29W222]|uniref:TonB C-terminal domain-containing protein n=1 Tax=Fulvivirga marina TaxID=2494733 RepID=A0A937KFA0_9BACT|nr:hypothetical protein [Fulvivirga marina]MBL6447978.1 hypothetical protein [Fulvivirga marina]
MKKAFISSWGLTLLLITSLPATARNESYTTDFFSMCLKTLMNLFTVVSVEVLSPRESLGVVNLIAVGEISKSCIQACNSGCSPMPAASREIVEMPKYRFKIS